MSISLDTTIDEAVGHIASHVSNYIQFNSEFLQFITPFKLLLNNRVAGFGIAVQSQYDRSLITVDFAIFTEFTGMGGILFRQILSFATTLGARIVIMKTISGSLNESYLHRMRLSVKKKSKNPNIAIYAFYLRQQNKI